MPDEHRCKELVKLFPLKRTTIAAQDDYSASSTSVKKSKMGKRKKSSRGPAKKVVQRLDATFNCLFCNHERSVTCTLDKKNSIGSLSCKVCGQTFQTHVNALSQPVDVYSDWFDAVEEVNAGKVSDSEGESDSESDYESDSDAELANKRRAQADSDEEEISDDEEAVGNSKRGRGKIVQDDEDDEDDDDDE